MRFPNNFLYDGRVTDSYSVNAEWYAALVAPWQDGMDSAVRTLLGPIDGGAVVDIASGVGTGLPLLHELGAQRLYAVEPSEAMRIGLMTTVARDPKLMGVTTVVPHAFPQASELLPAEWSAGVMLNALGHLDDTDRETLWATVASRLVPGGRFVLSLQPPEAVTEVPWADFGSVHIGDHVLQTRGKADPLSDTHVEWTMEWTLMDQDRAVIDSRATTYPWRVLSHDQVVDEASRHGLVEVHGEAIPTFVALEKPV